MTPSETDTPRRDACRRAEQVAWRNVAGETVIIDLETKAFYGLDALAGWIWGRLDGKTTVSGLVAATSDAGGSRAGRTEAIEALLTTLEERRLVQRSSTEDGRQSDTPSTAGPLPETAEYPPQLTWEEGLEAVAQPGRSCGFMPGQGDQCVGFPFQ